MEQHPRLISGFDMHIYRDIVHAHIHTKILYNYLLNVQVVALNYKEM